MPIARILLEVDIPFAQSLKDRRQVVRSIKDSLRRGFNLSAAEMDESPLWNRASIAAVAVHLSRSYLLGQMELAERAARRAANRYGADILSAETDLLQDEPFDDVPSSPASGTP